MAQAAEAGAGERNIRLVLAYDGTAYAGFQRQPNGVTVQEKLESAVKAATGQPSRLVAAGRTDAGVHSLGQVVSFRTASPILTARFPFALNSHLPRDIRVVAADEVAPGFHARFDARTKTYRYTIDNGRIPSPLMRHYALHVPQPLDVQAIREAARLLVGERDFAAFRSTGGAARTSVRTVFRLELIAPAVGLGGQLLALEVEADGFLYNMVRIIAGTLVEVGLGKCTRNQVTAALATGERTLAGVTLPPHGLCLVAVTY